MDSAVHPERAAFPDGAKPGDDCSGRKSYFLFQYAVVADVGALHQHAPLPYLCRPLCAAVYSHEPLQPGAGADNDFAFAMLEAFFFSREADEAKRADIRAGFYDAIRVDDG